MRKQYLIGALVVLALIICEEVVRAGCNPNEPFIVDKSRVTLRVVPCGPPGIPQNWWSVKVDGETSFNVPAVPLSGTNGEFLLPLGDFYQLNPGENRIDFRAMHVGHGGTILSETDTVFLQWPGPPTPTETLISDRLPETVCLPLGETEGIKVRIQ